MTQRQSRSCGNLYQLRHKTELAVGSYVAVNGPYDTYGVVLKVLDKSDKGYLHLIRGVPDQHKTVVASF